MSVPSTDQLPISRDAAINFYADFLVECARGAATDADAEKAIWHGKRKLARSDLFYLLTAILGRRDVNRDWLFQRCRDVQGRPDDCLDLWARGHYKSTIVTFGLTIMEILNDPEITIGIFADVNKVAKPFLRQIKREFEDNETLKSLFPEICYERPSREAPKWSEDEGIVVKRKSNPKESTVEAYGLLDGQPTGRHFSLRVYDDVVTVDTVSTPEQIQKVTDRLAMSQNLGAEGGRKRYAGTRYHANDAYAELIKRAKVGAEGGSHMDVRIFPATSDGTESGDPVLFTREALAEKRREMGPYVFGCQMLLNPTADRAQGFMEGWLRYWPAQNIEHLNKVILVDPASGKKMRESKNDYTAMWVVGLGGDRRYYVIDAIHARLNLTARTKVLFALHRRYRPRWVAYEDYGMQADVQHIEEEQARENYRFDVTPVAGRLSKVDRIRKLVPIFEQGRLYLPQSLVRRDHEGKAVDMVKSFINDEYLTFPVCTHDDRLDALARIEDEELVKLLMWPDPEQPIPEKSWKDDLWQHEDTTHQVGWMAR